jgi:hypothetical protein
VFLFFNVEILIVAVVQAQPVSDVGQSNSSVLATI